MSNRPVAVVTGSSRGLGRGIAEALAPDHDLVLGWNRSLPEARSTAATAQQAGARAILARCDVTDAGAVHELAAAAAEEFGRLDVWVNNAGVSVLAPLAETSEQQLRDQLEVNVVGVLHGMQAAHAGFTRSGTGGRLVNVASDLGLQAAPLLGAYSASKFAVIGLTQAAALEWAAAGITVNAVCPGTAETDMVLAERAAESAATGRDTVSIRSDYLAAIPSGRFCTPADVGALVSYLASPAAAYLTGQALCVNGGSVLR